MAGQWAGVEGTLAGAGSGVGWLAVGPAAVREAVMAAVEKGVVD